MLTFNEACAIAYDHYAKKGFYGLRASYDLGDKYGFMGNPDRVYFGGIVPITVSKAKGEIDQFLFFLPEVADALKNSKEMEIPAEFKPNGKSEISAVVPGLYEIASERVLFSWQLVP